MINFLKQTRVWFFILCTLVIQVTWVYADLTSHTEALLDALALVLDSNADGIITDETWFSEFILATEIDTEGKLESVSNTQIATETEAAGYVTTHVGESDPHTVYLLESNILDEDDMTTDSDTYPPSQQSVAAYVLDYLQSGWTIDLDTLTEDVPRLVTHLTFTAAQAFTTNAILYMKSDGADGGRLYPYSADATATDNDTYRFFCKATEASSGDGDSVIVRLFTPSWVMRDDTLTTTYNSSEGKSLVADDTGNGWEVFFANAPSGEGDHVEFTTMLIQAQDAGAGTHDIVMFFGGFDMNVIPAAP